MGEKKLNVEGKAKMWIDDDTERWSRRWRECCGVKVCVEGQVGEGMVQ